MSRHHQPIVRLRRPPQGMLHRLHAKMNRLPAHLTSEDDWKQDQPGVRLSRVFGVVLGIHIVAIGGLMAYEMFRHREHPAAAPTAFRPALREARPGTAMVAPAARVKDSFADDPKHARLRTHVVAPGEGLGEIAAQYGVDEKALHLKNLLGQGRAFKSGMKLVIPNRQLEAAAPMDPDRLLAGDAPARGAEPAAALAPVARPAFDPSLPVLRAEPVAEPAAPAAPAMAAVPKKKASAPAKKLETAAATKPKSKGRVHVVKSGENAYRIAKAYGVNVDQLVKTNGINPSALRPGTTLTIPPAR